MDEIHLNKCQIATEGGSHLFIIELIRKILTGMYVQACYRQTFIDVISDGTLGTGCVMLGVENPHLMAPLAEFLRQRVSVDLRSRYRVRREPVCNEK